ncbi:MULTISPECIES: cytochrome c biogenesis protein ResB [Protofrankia]|uniref:ResB family protein n=1 Tax=Candidatus Protofrankia datiscae TaxID=2716812 RepID=F8AW95_9ACTN|nr:ResB family protein [Candidatus Protofrankia datiscae]
MAVPITPGVDAGPGVDDPIEVAKPTDLTTPSGSTGRPSSPSGPSGSPVAEPTDRTGLTDSTDVSDQAGILTTVPDEVRERIPAVLSGPRAAGGGTIGAVGSSRPLLLIIGPVRRAWHQLTSMRTALLLLFLLALAAVPGSLLPQRSLNPLKVEEYFRDHPSLAPFLDRLSAFDVFGAPWFAAVYLLLFVSLIGCLTSRVRWHARALVGRPPRAPARPSRLAGGRSWDSALCPPEVVEAARVVLRRRRFRVAVAPEGATRPDSSQDFSVAAEKGYLRETGNLVFHIALVLMLLGVGLGSWFGYQGTVLVIQGDGFTNTLVSYDQFSRGKLVDPAGDLAPFSLTLEKFTASYQPNGQPADFRAEVAYSTDLGGRIRTADIRVNHPLAISSAKVYLIGHGYAPHFVLRNSDGSVVWEGYQPCTPRDAMFVSTCTLKIGDTGLPPTGPTREPQQLAFTGVFTPTTQLDPAHGYISTHPAATAPGLTLTGYVGNLHINEGVPQNVYSLDTRDMRQLHIDGPIGAGRVAQVLALNNPEQRTISGLPGGMTLEADGVREFATFQTKSDPFKGWVLVAAVAIIGGLLVSMRVRRRRVWLRARPAVSAPAGADTSTSVNTGTGSGPDADAGARAMSMVEVGGLSRSDVDGFAAELRAIIEDIRLATTPADGARPTRSGSPERSEPPGWVAVAPVQAPSGPPGPPADPGNRHREDLMTEPEAARASSGTGDPTEQEL